MVDNTNRRFAGDLSGMFLLCGDTKCETLLSQFFCSMLEGKIMLTMEVKILRWLVEISFVLHNSEQCFLNMQIYITPEVLNIRFVSQYIS